MPPPPFVEYFVVCGLGAKSLDKEASPSSGETSSHSHTHAQNTCCSNKSRNGVYAVLVRSGIVASNCVWVVVVCICVVY